VSAWLALLALAAALPFAPGERLVFRISYAHLTGGHASLGVTGEPGAATLRFTADAQSEGFFAWLFHFRVNDHTVARFDPLQGCSLGIEKHLREGKAVRDQVIVIDPRTGVAEVRDPKIKETRFQLEACPLDVLSALYVARIRGISEKEPLLLPAFDNGKNYVLQVRFVARDKLDLPPPLGNNVPTVIVEPQLAEGTGLFVKKGRLLLWLTDDARRIPVRMKSKVAIGSVGADLEAYTPPARP
jgi:Protein of unknown function (DUF3108)